MAKEIPSVGDLRKAAEIADHEIEAAVDAYSADLRAGPFRFASGYEIHVARAIERHMPAKMALADRTGSNRRGLHDPADRALIEKTSALARASITPAMR